MIERQRVFHQISKALRGQEDLEVVEKRTNQTNGGQLGRREQ